MGTVERNLAVIGAGYWGKNLVRVLGELGALAAVCDADEELAAKLARDHGGEGRRLQDVLDDPAITSVAVAAPAALHAELASAALEAGKHVFVEKPLALRVADAIPVVELAESRGLTLMVGHLLQYHPAFLALRDRVAAGVIGKLQYVYSNRLNLGKIRREEDILWSFAPHDLSMILSLVGEEPDRVSCVGSNFLSQDIADVTVTHLGFPSGVRGHVFVSWLHPYKEQRLVVVGSEGMLTFDDGVPLPDKVRFYGHRVDWVDGLPVPVKGIGEPVELPAAEPLRLELEHFLDCVATGKTPRTDGREGLGVLSVLERATSSMQNASAPR